MLDWIFKRIFTPKRCEMIAKNMIPHLSETAKDMIQDILEDEDIAQGVTAYGDELFLRYKKKVFGTIGGLQKGLNYAVEGENPLSGIIDEDGSISLSNIFKMGARHFFKGGGQPGQQNRPALPGNNTVKWPQ